MKTLLLITMLTTMTVQANVVCKKEGRYWRPSNATAIKIAKTLKVSTCSGKRFQAVVKQAGLKSNVPKTVRRMTVKELAASLKAK
jgi:hypothetical protein